LVFEDSVIWIFGFTLIILSFYTSNLAASLTVDRAASKVHGLDDLKVKGNTFGVVTSTSTEGFFLQSTMSIYRRQMKGYPNEPAMLEGLENGEISATVSDTPSQAFLSNRIPCDKYIVGSVFHGSNYGIGISVGNENTSALLHKAVLDISSQGIIEDLYHKWWSSGACAEHKDPAIGHIELGTLSGNFIFLAIGVLLAFALLVFDNIVYKYDSTFEYKHIHKCLGYTEEEYMEKKRSLNPRAAIPLERQRSSRRNRKSRQVNPDALTTNGPEERKSKNYETNNKSKDDKSKEDNKSKEAISEDKFKKPKSKEVVKSEEEEKLKKKEVSENDSENDSEDDNSDEDTESVEEDDNGNEDTDSEDITESAHDNV